MNLDAPLNGIQLVFGEAIIHCQQHGLQPKLRRLPISLNMDMPRFGPV
jgi:hypothetical protein